MSDEIPGKNTSTTGPEKPFEISGKSIAAMGDLVRGLVDDRNKKLQNLILSGIPAMPDLNGMIVPENGYMLIIGKKLWDTLNKEPAGG